MPFRSRQQMKAAFSGALGPVMKRKAKKWASETPNIKALPKRVGKSVGKKKGKKGGKKHPKKKK